MVRCGQHATLAVQLASSAASSGPSWARKSSSFVAAPPIAEEESSAEASSQSASPSPPMPLAAGALNVSYVSAVAADVPHRARRQQLAASARHALARRASTAQHCSPGALLASEEGAACMFTLAGWIRHVRQESASWHWVILLALNGQSRADSNARDAQPQQALSGSHCARPTHAGDVFREPQPCRGICRGLPAARQQGPVSRGARRSSGSSTTGVRPALGRAATSRGACRGRLREAGAAAPRRQHGRAAAHPCRQRRWDLPADRDSLLLHLPRMISMSG